MKAGIDFGTSLVKTAWMKDGVFRFSSSADASLEEIARQLSEDDVKIIHVAGIGYSKDHAAYFQDFQVKTAEGDPIENEVRLQADGARRMLLNTDYHGGGHFLLVSIGTGTSYTLVTPEGAARVPIGNSLSGGFIRGLGSVLGAIDYNELSRISAEAQPLDLTIKDMLPSKAGTFEGELVVANFGKGNSNSTKADAYASAISTVAVAIIRDIMLLGMMPGFEPPSDVVYIGSTVTRTPLLRGMLEKYSVEIVGKNPFFPARGEFALALGAYHMQE